MVVVVVGGEGGEVEGAKGFEHVGGVVTLGEEVVLDDPSEQAVGLVGGAEVEGREGGSDSDGGEVEVAAAVAAAAAAAARGLAVPAGEAVAVVDVQGAGDVDEEGEGEGVNGGVGRQGGRDQGDGDGGKGQIKATEEEFVFLFTFPFLPPSLPQQRWHLQHFKGRGQNRLVNRRQGIIRVGEEAREEHPWAG
jgi:hypothetical protein